MAEISSLGKEIKTPGLPAVPKTPEIKSIDSFKVETPTAKDVSWGKPEYKAGDPSLVAPAAKVESVPIPSIKTPDLTPPKVAFDRQILVTVVKTAHLRALREIAVNGLRG